MGLVWLKTVWDDMPIQLELFYPCFSMVSIVLLVTSGKAFLDQVGASMFRDLSETDKLRAVSIWSTSECKIRNAHKQRHDWSLYSATLVEMRVAYILRAQTTLISAR